MAADGRSELCSEQNVFSLQNIETMNSNEGGNQDFEVGTEFSELSTTPWTENNTNDDENQIEIIEYNVEIFIALVQEEPCLWNTSFRAYKDQTKKKNAWSNIAAKFGKDIEFLKAQWKNLKENFKRCLDKRNRMTKSGAGAQSLPTCKYFQNLQFLKDKIGNKETESNISLPDHHCHSLPNMRNGAQQQTSAPNTSIGAQQQILISNTSAGTQQQISMPNTSSNTQQLDSCTASVIPSSVKRKNCSDASSATTKQKRLAREELSNRVDSLTLKYLDDMKSSEKEYNQLLEKEDDPDMLFLKSLHASLSKLTKRKNRQARMKIQQVLFELEESDDDSIW